MPLTKNQEAEDIPFFMQSKPATDKTDVIRLQCLPVELQQPIYFFAFDPHLTMENDKLKAYTAYFKEETTLPTIVSASKSVRLTAFHPLIRSSTSELAHLEEETIEQVQAYIDMNHLAFNFVKNIRNASIKIRYAGWNSAIATAELVSAQCIAVNSLVIDSNLWRCDEKDWDDIQARLIQIVLSMPSLQKIEIIRFQTTSRISTILFPIMKCRLLILRLKIMEALQKRGGDKVQVMMRNRE